MQKNTLFYCFLPLFLMLQSAFAQVDVIYKDLVWSDEFETNGAINPVNWHHQTQLPAGGNWYNGEAQHYTNQLANSFVSNGFMNIVAKRESFTSQGFTKQFTSARLNSTFAFKYGRVDVRAKIPKSQGTWPAIWTLGKNINEDGAFFDAEFGNTNWPACGEIDLMEYGITPYQPTNYIQSALHTPSSFGNTINIGGTIANNLGSEFHVYSVNWSPFQITFLLDNVPFYTYNPSVKNASTWPFDAEQYLLLNIAMGGVAGTIPPSFSQATMEFDYVRVYQNITTDTQSPTNFTATIGARTSSSIELLLNGNDDSGTVVYNITYGTTNLSFANPSGIQKSVIIPNLNPNTNYSFNIRATDIAGNNNSANLIILNASTIGFTGCSGTDTVATEGSFSNGYNFNFETIGTDVKVTFQLLDTNRVGVVAYLWRQSPFSEQSMTNVSGNIFTRTIPNQTIGSTINYAVKFAYANGLSVTRYIPYIVGQNCTLSINNSQEPINFTFENPIKNNLQISSNSTIDKIQIFNMLGSLIKEYKTDIKDIDVSNLVSGVYLLAVYSGNNRVVRKIIKE